MPLGLASSEMGRVPTDPAPNLNTRLHAAAYAVILYRCNRSETSIKNKIIPRKRLLLENGMKELIKMEKGLLLIDGTQLKRAERSNFYDRSDSKESTKRGGMKERKVPRVFLEKREN